MTRIPCSSARPAPAGPYSPGMRVGDLVFTAGQAGVTPTVSWPDITARPRKASSMCWRYSPSGAEEKDVAYASGRPHRVEDFEAMNEVYASVFREPFPARTTRATSTCRRDARRDRCSRTDRGRRVRLVRYGPGVASDRAPVDEPTHGDLGRACRRRRTRPWDGWARCPRRSSTAMVDLAGADRLPDGASRQDRVRRSQLCRPRPGVRAGASDGAGPVHEGSRHRGRARDPVHVPPGAEKVDWEVELGVVIGRRAATWEPRRPWTTSPATSSPTTSPSGTTSSSAAVSGTRASPARRSTRSGRGS